MADLRSFLLFWVLLWTTGTPLAAQWLEIGPPDSIPEAVRETARGLEGPYPDSLAQKISIDSLRKSLYRQGYLLARLQILEGDSIDRLILSPGPRLYYQDLELILPDDFAIPYKAPRSPEAGPLNFKRLEILAENHLQRLENNGYPFARLELAQYRWRDDTLQGQFRLEPGQVRHIDSIILKGYDRLPRPFLRHDLGLERGMLYDENLIRQLPQRIPRLGFLRMTRPPAVAFNPDKTSLYLYLEEQAGNQIDGVLGLNTEETGEITLTGDFRLRLVNTLKKGEQLDLRWQRPDESVQSLDLQAVLPYLFGTPFWLEGDLGIFRQDSSFTNTRIEALTKYVLESANFITGGMQWRSSSVPSGNEGGLPGLNAYSTRFFKLGLELRQTNRLIVPTRGWELQAYGLTGHRSTTEDRLEQLAYEANLAWYQPFGRHIFKSGLVSESLFGEGLYLNEVYRLGGLRRLRGFNEQSIFSSSYVLGSLEYRFMTGEYDYLMAFVDVAWSELNTVNEFSSQIYTGLGAGINFETGAGVFSLIYAIGRDRNSPFDLRTSKVHFGYVNQF